MLPDQIAIVGESGEIVAFNDAWVQFAVENGNPDLIGAGLGDNYIEACRGVTGPGARLAREAHEGIVAVLDGTKDYFEMDYPCHSPTTERWFTLQVFPLVYAPGFALLTHSRTRKTEGPCTVFYSGLTRGDGSGREHSTLAPRQNEVLQLLVRGRSYREIATEMGISEKTVNHHIAVLKRKLGCNGSRDLVRVAICEGLSERVDV